MYTYNISRKKHDFKRGIDHNSFEISQLISSSVNANGVINLNNITKRFHFIHNVWRQYLDCKIIFWYIHTLL